MASRGVELTYTERLDDLNTANIARYDALMLYANIDAITPEAEKALLGLRRGGRRVRPGPLRVVVLPERAGGRRP